MQSTAALLKIRREKSLDYALPEMGKDLGEY
jgi:hypothetical protein